MKSDARLLLNKKKFNKGSGVSKPELWRSRGTVDARKILNLKRSQKLKPPVLGSYMRTKTTTALIASQIRKEIAPLTKAPEKRIEVSKDGNIIVTAKSKKVPQIVREAVAVPKVKMGASSRNAILGQNLMKTDPLSVDMDDLEHTTVDDVLDFDSLPPAFVASKPVQNLSRKSAVSQILEKKHTMVADQLSEDSASFCARVYVYNLHQTVSKEDVMELFGNVGLIKSVEMMRPGTAVVDFYDENDAEKACDLYHNRLLDGVPMKCYLQSGPQKQRCTISQRLGERMQTRASSSASSSLPSVSTNPRSRYNPRNVQFTVKLT